MLSITNTIQIPLDEFQFSYARSGGPGGQNVNKVNSKAILRWSVLQSQHLPGDVRERFAARYRSRLTADGEIVITSQRYRDQARNVDDCLNKLRLMILVVAMPPVKRKRTRPTRASKERRLEQKRQRSQTKSLRQSREA